MGEYDASGVETATNIVGPDGWRERTVPNWGPNGSDYYGPSATDDFFAFDPQDSAAERIRLDFSTNSGNYDGGAYLYDESAYNAWGERLLDYSPLGTSNSASGAQQIGQTDTAGYEAQFGYQTDTATGLLLAGHRFYQPQTRRWLNRDPIGYAGGTNLYEYADDDPVNEADPDGTDGSTYANANFNPFAYFSNLFNRPTQDFAYRETHNKTVDRLKIGLNVLSFAPVGPLGPERDLAGAVEVGEGINDAVKAHEAEEAAANTDAARSLGDMSGEKLGNVVEKLKKAGFEEKPRQPGSTSPYREFKHPDGSKVSIATHLKVVKVNAPSKWAADGSRKIPDRLEPHNQPYTDD